MFDKITEVVIGLLVSIYRLTTTVAAGVTSLIFTGTLIVRQPGGVAGTDEGQIVHNGTKLSIDNKQSTGNILFGIPDGVSAGSTYLNISDAATPVLTWGSDPTTNIDFYVAVNKVNTTGGGQFGWSANGAIATTADTGLERLAAAVCGPTNGSTGTGWLQQEAGRSRVTGDVTSSDVTMTAITGLSATLIAGRIYTGFMVLKCSESVAAEGIRVDFAGGTATMTSFAAGAGILEGGTAVKVNAVSSALATDFDWSTITGETWIRFEITMVVNGAGTFIPRFSQSVDAGGTVTVSLGSYLWLDDMPA